MAGVLLAGIAVPGVARGDDADAPNFSSATPAESATTSPAVGNILATGAGAAGSVLSVIAHADGSVTYAFATLPPVDASLSPPNSGVGDPSPVPDDVTTGVGSPNSVPPPGGGCDFGTATGIVNSNTGTCPPLHWERFHTTHAYWYIEDHTGSAWPVYASQIEWNKSCCVGAYYAGTACSSSFHCVKAYEGKYSQPCGSAPKWTGCTYVTSESNTTNHISSVYIQYNDLYTITGGEHRQVACQEQGHAMGMGHNSSLSSCMFGTTRTDASTVPSGDDFGELQYEIYNH